MGNRRKKHKSSPVWNYVLLAIVLFVFISNQIGSSNTITGIILIIIALSGLFIYSNYQKSKRYLESGINDIDIMSGEEFEVCLKHHFQKLGYRTELTPKSNDYGADLILQKDGSKTVVQAKRYNSTVGIKAIQEVVGAINYYGADKAMVITNNYFTPNAINLARTSNIMLLDRDTIIRSFSLNN